MRSKYLRWILLGLILLILSPFIFWLGSSIYTGAKIALLPSATEQLLDFAELPRDTALPGQNPRTAGGTDYHQIEETFLQRFPVGTSKLEFEQFVTKHDRSLMPGQTCDVYTESINCIFNNGAYLGGEFEIFSFLLPCDDSVYLTFLFDASNGLKEIKIIGVTNCV